MLSAAMRSVSSVLAGLLLLGLPAADAASANRLADIRERGALHCAIWPYVPGFAVERDGDYSGFDVDICRAVAAAVFGDPKKVEFVVLESVKQFAERTDVDLVVRRLTATPTRERSSGMVFGPIVYYDGQGFLVPKAGNVKRALQLSGKGVCVLNRERHPETLRSYFRDNGSDVRMIMVESDKEAERALRTNRCLAYSADVTWLAAARSTFSDGLSRYDILPDSISKEPLAPLIRAEDGDLVQLVQWTVYSMIEAEELGLNSRNINAHSNSPRVRAFLRIHPGSGVVLGAGEWVQAIVASVGNYGEMFERNLGPDTRIRLDRGLNRLWSNGGLMYALPLDR